MTAPPKTSSTASPDLESRTVPILKREDVVYKSVRNLLGEEKEVVDLVFSEEQVADMDKGLEDGGETSTTTLDLEERTKEDGEVEEKEIHEPVQRPTAMDVEDTKKEDEGEVQTIHVTVRSQDEIAPHSVEDDEVDEREVFVIMEQQIVKTNEMEMKQEARLQHEVEEEEEEEMRTEVRAGEEKSEGAVAREDKREEREVPVEIKVELEGDGTTDVRPDDFADLVSLSPSCSFFLSFLYCFVLFDKVIGIAIVDSCVRTSRQYPKEPRSCRGMTFFVILSYSFFILFKICSSPALLLLFVSFLTSLH